MAIIKKKFIYVSGKKLYNTNGKVFHIKGIGFGNNVWYTQNSIPSTDHDEQSYKELADLGFNSVRFYINASLFEKDSTPYVYNETAFNWLKQNIGWARKYNIKLLINMHIPQGGQFNSSNVNLWVKAGYKDRFVALWKEIAKRYANEVAILGYGLLNEPFVPVSSSAEASLNMYYDLMNLTATAIRSVDKNHVLFVERPYGTVNTATKKINYAWGDTGSFRLIKDKNTAYEFHFYDRNEFVFQGLSWLNYKNKWVYNSDKIAILSGARSVVKTYINDSIIKYNNTSSDWQYLESDFITPTKTEENYGYWMVYAYNLGANGSLFIDDLVVKEYNSKKEYVRDLYTLSFDPVTACDGWDLGSGGGGTCSFNSTIGHTKLGSTQISGVQKSYRIYKNYSTDNYFPIKAGNSYKICAYGKFTGVNADAKVKLSLQACHADKVYALDKTYLRSRLEVFMNLGNLNNVPMYLGEYGVPHKLMGNEYKGEQWVIDMIALLNEYGLGYSYHDYHEENFGLYTNDSRYPRTGRNEILYKIFSDYVS